MLRTLSRRPDDPLLGLIELYQAYARPGKIDLGVGVYRDEFGATPVLQAVKAAEQLLLQSQTNKAYVGPVGDSGRSIPSSVAQYSAHASKQPPSSAP